MILPGEFTFWWKTLLLHVHLRGIHKDLAQHFYNVELTQVIKHLGGTSFLCMSLNCLVKYLGFPNLIFLNGCDEYHSLQREETFLTIPCLVLRWVQDPAPCPECLVCSTNSLWAYLSARTSAGWHGIIRYYSVAGGPQNYHLYRIFFTVYNLKITSCFSSCLIFYVLILTAYKNLKIFPVN